jgi:hypothetical protein
MRPLPVWSAPYKTRMNATQVINAHIDGMWNYLKEECGRNPDQPLHEMLNPGCSFCEDLKIDVNNFWDLMVDIEWCYNHDDDEESFSENGYTLSVKATDKANTYEFILTKNDED